MFSQEVDNETVCFWSERLDEIVDQGMASSLWVLRVRLPQPRGLLPRGLLFQRPELRERRLPVTAEILGGVHASLVLLPVLSDAILRSRPTTAIRRA
jgi:hypothetical protein